MQTVLRYLLMLRHIPKQPQKIDVNTLRERLSEQGVDVSVRTIQRNLIELSEVFPLTTDERNKPFGWSLMSDVAIAPLVPGIMLERTTQQNGTDSAKDGTVETVQLELRCDAELKSHFESFPLNETQRLRSNGEGLLLTAEVAHTDKLLAWLLSYGARIEVLEPEALRQQVAEQVVIMRRYYDVD